MTTDPLEALVLARARDGLRPAEQRRAQVLERMAANMHRMPVESLAPCPDPPSQVKNGEVLRTLLNGSGRVMFTPRALVCALVLGAAAGWGGAHLSPALLGSTAHQRAQPALAAGREVAPEGEKRGQGQSRDVARGEPRTTRPSPIELAALPHGPDEGEAKQTVNQLKVRHASTSAVGPADQVSVYEELSYLRRAQAALRDGQSALALGLMENLDAMPTRGALRAERNMTKVLALCQLGRAQDAKTIATRMAQLDAGQVYRKRLEASCAGTMHDSAREK